MREYSRPGLAGKREERKVSEQARKDDVDTMSKDQRKTIHHQRGSMKGVKNPEQQINE